MITALPTLVEKNIHEYLTANYGGGYSLCKGFSAAEIVLPAVVIKAGRFVELSPNTGVFEGDLSLSIITQIDEAEDPLAAHDEAVGAIYSLVNSDAMQGAFNALAAGHLWGSYIDGFDQERQDRSFVSVLTLKIHVQALAQ